MSGEFAAFEAKMAKEGLPAAAIESYRYHYEQFLAGGTGVIPEREIEPVESLPDAEALPEPPADTERLLRSCAVIKLNGGLGTSMGMTRAKSLLPVRGDQTFLDIIAEQTLHARGATRGALPIVFMNSYRTRTDTLAALSRYPELEAGQTAPLDFLQNKVPRIVASDATPFACAEDPDAEWCPPGHGDLYPAMLASGALASLREAGVRYAFVSNADNLGAVFEPKLLHWFAESGAAFAMEVCRRTPAHRKGGHLAKAKGGGLVLREIAQCPDDEIDAFQDTQRYRFFNTNNLWLELDRLADALEAHGGFLPLPMIRNRKDVHGRAVVQLESAMGAAIGVFRETRAIAVSHLRFAPVKTVGDLLLVRSDAYALGDDHRLRPAANPLPRIDLDPERCRDLEGLDALFPSGPPSLRECGELRVRGPVRFGKGVVCRGSVRLEVTEPAVIPDGAVLRG